MGMAPKFQASLFRWEALLRGTARRTQRWAGVGGHAAGRAAGAAHACALAAAPATAALSWLAAGRLPATRHTIGLKTGTPEGCAKLGRNQSPSRSPRHKVDGGDAGPEEDEGVGGKCHGVPHRGVDAALWWGGMEATEGRGGGSGGRWWGHVHCACTRMAGGAGAWRAAGAWQPAAEQSGDAAAHPHRWPACPSGRWRSRRAQTGTPQLRPTPWQGPAGGVQRGMPAACCRGGRAGFHTRAAVFGLQHAAHRVGRRSGTTGRTASQVAAGEAETETSRTEKKKQHPPGPRRRPDRRWPAPPGTR